MKRIFMLGVLVMSLMLAGSAIAAGKIGLVNLQRALNEVNEGKRAMSAIQAQVDAKKKDLDTRKAELKTLKDEVEKQRAVLSKEALQTKMGEIQLKFTDLQQKAMQYDQELKQKENESVQRILKALRDEVLLLAKSGQYEIIYENSTQNIIYTAAGVDITDEVINSYNKKR